MNTKIKILALIPYKVFPPNMGGQRAIALFYRSLCKIIPLTAFTIKDNISDEDFEIINTISNSKIRYLNPFLFFQLKKIANQKQATHILFEHPYYAWLIFILKFFTNFKVIIHSHNIESARFRSIGKWWWKILWHYEKWAYENATTIWFITENDKQYAIENYSIAASKSFVIPYGTNLDSLPLENEIDESKKILKQKHQIKSDDNVLLFNGALGYKPNIDAVKNIVEKINPILLKANYRYKIIICGKGLPAEFNDLKDFENIIYAGFVEDIDLYFKACDVFINPVVDGGGIKTKLVEALGFGKNCVSTKNGAIGVDKNLTEGRLKIVEDNNWNLFADEIIHSFVQQNKNEIFYQTFNWKYIAQKAIESLV